jgi:hypothetical protein
VAIHWRATRSLAGICGAEHRVGQRRGGCARGGCGEHGPAAAQHRDIVRNAQCLTKLVRDEHHGVPLVGETAKPPEKRHALGRRQHGGRLVEHENSRMSRQCLRDLDTLLCRDREPLHPHQRIEREASALGERSQPCDRPLHVQHAVIAERDVLGDGHHRHEGEMLVHHADAECDRVGRTSEPHGGSSHLDAARIRAFHAVRDAHERGFAGAVLTEQRMHGSGTHAQRR